jgi:DNA invertase Pin-like site-specific DNA recombinase
MTKSIMSKVHLQRLQRARAEAVAAGVTLGRKPKLSAGDVAEVRVRYEQGESLLLISADFGVSHSTLSRLLRKKLAYTKFM